MAAAAPTIVPVALVPSGASAMATPSVRKRFRWFDYLGLAAIAALLAVVAWVPAQERRSESQKSAEQPEQPAGPRPGERLDAIEKTLQTLLKEVQGLKTPTTEPRSTQTPSTP